MAIGQYHYLKTSRQDRILTVRLNRPDKRNAFHPELVKEITDVYTHCAVDDSLRAVILEAEGEVFSAGADLEYLRSLKDNDYNTNLEDSQAIRAMFEAIYTCPLLTIAKVEGHAIAGGAGLATACDRLYITEEAKLGYSEVSIGFVPAIVMVFLLRKVTGNVAHELLTSGRLFTAKKLEAMGLVYQVCTKDNISPTIEKHTSTWMKKVSGMAYSSTKALMQEVQSHSIQAGLEMAEEINARARQFEDCQQGIQAFLDKQSIEW